MNIYYINNSYLTNYCYVLEILTLYQNMCDCLFDVCNKRFDIKDICFTRSVFDLDVDPEASTSAELYDLGLYNTYEYLMGTVTTET